MSGADAARGNAGDVAKQDLKREGKRRLQSMGRKEQGSEALAKDGYLKL